jgi:hypothetical protein
MCKDYVEWFNDLNPGAWPTWTPGDHIEPGDIGFFGKEKNFRKYTEVPDVEVTPERPVPAQLHFRAKDFSVTPSAAVSVPIGGHPIAFAGGEVIFTAHRENACVLQIDQAFSCELVDRPTVLERVRQWLIAKQWPIDAVLVTRRVRAEAGIAFILDQRGQSVKVQAEGEVSPGGLVTLAKVEVNASISRQTFGAEMWKFNSDSTPFFMDAIRIHTKWWARLIPGLGPVTGRQITDHAGHKWDIDKPPWNLQHLSEDQRLYDPRQSVMRPEEIEALSLEDLFQVVSHLGVEDREPPPEGGQSSEGGLYGGSGDYGVAVERPGEREVVAGAAAPAIA